jgi:hypothetical protein
MIKIFCKLTAYGSNYVRYFFNIPGVKFFLVIEFRKNYENKKIGGEIGRLG